jgi:hypothetical protein
MVGELTGGMPVSALRIAHTMGKVIKQGRLLFAIAVAGIGAEHLICAHVSQLVFANNPPAVPVLPFVPPIRLLVYVVGIVLLAAGACMPTNIRPCFAAPSGQVRLSLWECAVGPGFPPGIPNRAGRRHLRAADFSMRTDVVGGRRLLEVACES